MMFSTWYSALMERSVVKLPGPAMSGKTTGKRVEEFPVAALSFLKISTPKIISMERMSKTMPPATENA